MFVTASDFDLIPYSIPNLDKKANTFAAYTDEQEAKVLKKLLGVTLYNSFVAGLAALPGKWVSTAPTVINQQYYYGTDIWKALTVQTFTAPVAGVDWELVEEDNKWLKLRDGADYEYSSKTYHWDGMVTLLKPYIYSIWLRDTFDTHAGIGVVQGKSENADVIDPSTRIARAYNEYAGIAGVMRGRGYQPGLCYGSYDTRYREFYEYYNHENTLYGFLYANKSDYPNWCFKDPGLMNALGI